ncbi:DUF1656 domain-containing protein [Rhizobium paknamense]|uniref:DUF1656 domain-containing protein n=1 Tax=Rhizobium paknamense TaxID=1206817 RepID=A0ABU0I698_9HYPH|nr:DUF1656 domain-containing protein [Rhizobium paknamense]MDQ0453746.1 hypothetical protein [Rhizobium paknamense]
MPSEIDLYGLFVPRLLLLMLAALVISILLRKGLAWIGFYRLVWHRGLFDIALYTLLLGGLSALANL